MEDNKLKEVDIDVEGEIELPQLDVKQYIGQKVKIAACKTCQGTFGYMVQVITAPVAQLKDGKDITASRIFGLQQDADGKIGWGKETALGIFLSKMKVKHYKDLVGKEVIVQTRTSKNDGKEYLTF